MANAIDRLSTEHANLGRLVRLLDKDALPPGFGDEADCGCELEPAPGAFTRPEA